MLSIDELAQQFSGDTIIEFSDKLNFINKINSWIDEIPESELNI